MNRNPDVDQWLAASGHPLAGVMQRVRDTILEADSRLEECIKWKSPTFTFKGNLASINPQAKQYVSLRFHRGAEIPGAFPSLQGGGSTARYMRFVDEADVQALGEELQAIVRACCTLKTG